MSRNAELGRLVGHWGVDAAAIDGLDGLLDGMRATYARVEALAAEHVAAAPATMTWDLEKIAGADPHALPPERLNRRGVVEFLRAQGHPLGELSDTRLDAVFETVGHTNRLVRGHRHARYEGAALHFQAALDHADSGLDPRMWRPHVGTLTCHAVDSTHAGLPGAAATACIAPILDACLRTADRPAPVAATA